MLHIYILQDIENTYFKLQTFKKTKTVSTLKSLRIINKQINERRTSQQTN